MSDFTDALRRSQARKAGSTNLAPAGGDFADSLRRSQARQQPKDQYGPTNPHPYVYQMAEEMAGNEAAWRKPGNPNLNPDATASATDARMQQLRRMEEETSGVDAEDVRENIGVDERYRGMDEFNKAHPIHNALAGYQETLGGYGTGALGWVAPETANRLQLNIMDHFGPASGAAGNIGRGAGIVVGLLPAIFSGTPALWMGSQGFAGGFGNSRMATQQARLMDYRDKDTDEWMPPREISFVKEFGAALAHGTVEGLSGLISGGMSKQMGFAIKSLAPDLHNVLRYSGKEATITLFKNIMKSGVKWAGGSAGEFLEEYSTQVVSNAITNAFEIGDPAYTEGALAEGFMGAAIHLPMSIASSGRYTARKLAAGKGQPHIPGTHRAEKPRVGSPSSEGIALYQTHTRALNPTGEAHEMTKAQFVRRMVDEGLVRADRVIKRVAGGNIPLADAIYKALNMAVPVSGEPGMQGRMVRADQMEKSKAKPKDLYSEKTLNAVAKAVREASTSQPMSPKDAKVRAQEIIDTVAKATLVSRNADEARAYHRMKVIEAFMDRRVMNQKVLDEYKDESLPKRPKGVRVSIRTDENSQEMSEEDNDTWNEDAYGSDNVNFAQENKNDVDSRDPGVLDIADPKNSHTWHVQGRAWASEDAEIAQEQQEQDDAEDAYDKPYVPKFDPNAPLPTRQDDPTIPDHGSGPTIVPNQPMNEDGFIEDARDESIEDEIDEYGDEFDPSGLSESDTPSSRGELDVPVGDFDIVTRDGIFIEGPFEIHAEADARLDEIQREAGVKDGERKGKGDRLSGWDPVMSQNPPQPPHDGTPPDASPEEPMPGSRNWFTEGLLYSGNQIEDTISPISSRIMKINKRIYGRLMKLEMMTGLATLSDIRKVRGFVKAKNRTIIGRWWNMMSPLAAAKRGRDTLLAHDRAIANGEWKVAEQILRDNAPLKENGDPDIVAISQLIAGQRQVQEVLKDLQARQRAAGIQVGNIEDYFPRAVKNYKRYKAFMGEKIDSMLEKKINAGQKQKGQEKLTDAELVRITNEHIQGYGEQDRGPKSVRHTAQRTVDKITDKNQHLYERGDVALHQYISRANETIQVAKFLGKEIGDGTTLDSIGRWVTEEVTKGNLTYDQAEEIGQLMLARFTAPQRSPNKFWRAIRDTGYLTVLANPFSAMTQLGDIALSVLTNGLVPTAIGIGKVFTKEGMKQAEIGITQATIEFGKPHGMRKVLDWALYGSGFKLADGFGKRVNMNAALHKFRKEANGKGQSHFDADGTETITGRTKGYVKFEAEWAEILGRDEFNQTVLDLRSGVISDNVRLMMWMQLSKTQPISLSEMPVRYLLAGNGRLFYMLRSFTIKQLDFARRAHVSRIYNGLKTKNGREVTEGMRGLASFFTVFVLAGASVDMAKNFLMGKDMTWDLVWDEIVDNFWKVFGLGKYSVDAIAEDGPYTAALEFFSPPGRWIDDLARDATNLFRGEPTFNSARDIPIVGQFFDYGTPGIIMGGDAYPGGKSAERIQKQNRKRAKVAAVEATEDGDINAAKAILAVYNERRPDNVKKLQWSSVRSTVMSRRTKILKEAREKERERMAR